VKTSIIKKFPVFNEKTIVINSGIDLDFFKKEKKDYSINGTIKVGMAGRFDKNQGDLIHVACELRKRGIPIIIHFAGSGKPEEERSLKELSERLGILKNVVFRGNIPRQSMSHFYLDMDIIASTMKREGLSLVAIEAMSNGLPFIAYNAPGFNEVIDDTVNGILVDGGVKEFATALQLLIESSETRKKIGQNAIKKAWECFGIETNVYKYLNFASGLLVKKGLLNEN
jgi:glycosyltransferase involved in cell wall biosynthesis